MCWFFHKWGKWSELKNAIYTNVLNGVKHEGKYQERYCNKCGKYESRDI